MFYIKKISLLTGTNVISTLDLELGLNIKYGESNIGKSPIVDCIDYMFGATEHRFDAKLQIKQIMMILDVDGKNLTMWREIDSNDFEVSSSVEYIDSDTYKAGNAKNVLMQYGLQQELLKRANARQDYEDLADEIDRLLERKQKVMVDNAEQEGLKKRILEMKEFLAD